MAITAPKQDHLQDEDEGDTGLFAEINITPLTDVILVLLIIFMVSSSAMVDAMREGMIDVNLPSAATASQEATESNPLILGITAEGRLFVQGEAMNEERLLELLKEEKTKNEHRPIVVQADGALQHRRVVEIIDLLRKSGFERVGIAAEAEP